MTWKGITLALILAVCCWIAPIDSAPAAEGGPTITLAQSTDVDTWDPFGDNATSLINIKRNVYENLTTRDNQLALAPLLATSWRQTNPTTWRFALRQHVTFHGGEPFTAADVKYSLEHILDPASKVACRSWIAGIATVDAVDDHTVDIHTKAPDAILPSRLSFCSFIVPSKLVQDKGLPYLAQHPDGTGPFRFVSWRRDQGTEMERNPTYWGKKAVPSRVRFLAIPEASSRVAALLAGQVDIAGGIPTDLISRLSQDRRIKVRSVRNGRVYFIILNAHIAPFDNRAVRQAMNYAVNVQAMLDYLFKDHGARVATICGAMWDGCDTSQTPYPYNPQRARALLRDAGFPNGFSTVLAMSPQRPTGSVDVTQSIVQQLKQVGVTAKIESYEWANYDNLWITAKAPMYYQSFGTPVLNIDDIIGGYFDPARRARWYTPSESLVKLSTAAVQTVDPTQRKVEYRKYLEGIKEEAPWIFLWNLDDIVGVNASVSGFVPRSDEMWDVTAATK